MRVLVVSNMWPGPRKLNYGVFVADRVDAYRRLGVDVAVVANDDPRRGQVRNALKYLRLLVRTVWAAVFHRPDVVEGHYLRPTAFHTRVAAAVSGCPYVLYAHGSDVVARPSRWLTRVVRGAGEVHTNSEHTAERIRVTFGKVGVVVSPPGVDLERFHPGDPEPGRVVFVGDLVSHKGVDVLLEAMSLLDGPLLSLVGDGPQRPELERQIDELQLGEQVELVGRVGHDHVADHMKRAWVVAVPSRIDAFGQVAAEALACGVPVVVSDVGGLASLPNGGTGTAVESGDASALAAGLRRWLGLSAEQRREVGAAARQRAERFEIDTVAAEALARLQLVAAGERLGKL